MYEKKTCTSQCRKWNSIMCRDVKRYQLGSELIKETQKQFIGSSRFKVMYFPIYSLQMEVIKESLKSQI